MIPATTMSSTASRTPRERAHRGGIPWRDRAGAGHGCPAGGLAVLSVGHARRRAASRAVRWRYVFSSAVRPGARAEEAAFLLEVDQGTHRPLRRAVPVVVQGVRLGPGAVFGGGARRWASKAAAETVEARAVRPGRRALAGAIRARTITATPTPPPGVAPAASKRYWTQPQKAVQALWRRFGSCSWYRGAESSRRAAARAGSRSQDAGGPPSPCAAVAGTARTSPARSPHQLPDADGGGLSWLCVAAALVSSTSRASRRMRWSM